MSGRLWLEDATLKLLTAESVFMQYIDINGPWMHEEKTGSQRSQHISQ